LQLGFKIGLNGPAIWRTERKEIALQAILAKVPACREGVLPDNSTGQSPGTRQLAGQKAVTMQDLNCVQIRALPTVAERRWVSGRMNRYKFVLSAGAKAKSVTSNLPILSVL